MKKQVNKKRIILIVAVAVLAAAALTFGVLAYMFRHQTTGFTPVVGGKLDCQVIEEFDPDTGLKSSIKVQNGGNAESYLRLHLVSYWQDADGNVMLSNVVGKPSSMPEIYYDSSNWLKDPDDQIYYYKSPVKPGDTTKDLLSFPMQLTTGTWDNGETVYQVVEVFAETVQKSPASAAEESWGVKVGTDGKLSF